MGELNIENSYMNVNEFFDTIEQEYNGNKLYRFINVSLKEGKKVPFGEKNNLTQEELNGSSRGNGNTLSLYVKHIQDLYVVDFDTKIIDNCKFYDILNDDCVANTETTKGSHYYIKIIGIPVYTNQQKVYIDENVEMDLIKKNNIWETRTRMINGTIKTYEWDTIKQYFNVEKMGINDSISPPVSPPSSDNNDDEPQGWADIDDNTPLPKCSLDDFKKHLSSIKTRYDYDSWVKIGMICYNNFNGDVNGLKIWNDYSKEDEENYEGKKALKKKYLTFNGDSNKLSYKQLIRWNIIDYPPKNKYEGWYKTNSLIENMNEECMYYTNTGDILYFSNNNFIRNKTAIAKQYYKKFSFEIACEEKTKIVNPFDLWLDSIDRKDVDKIVFNPKNTCKSNEFNIWKGFKIKPTGQGDETKIQKWLNHIKHIWASDDEDTYNYMLNWFAKILQQPWKKNNICLVLHSIEGVGKSFILDMIGQIIGDEYYYSTSSLKHILGEFNGDAEGKILVNLNETNWGGDKKMVGSFKEFITDSCIVINKKGIQSYKINNFANSIITTNEEWIVNINDNDRRFNLRECNNIKYDPSYYKEIAKTDLQEIANYLYTRDISSYDSRVFVKSELHKEQVEKNMDSVELFWKSILEGNINYDWGYHEVEYSSKSSLYELYCTSITATHEITHNQIQFWKTLRKICSCIIFKESYTGGARQRKYKVPTIEKAIESYEKKDYHPITKST